MEAQLSDQDKLARVEGNMARRIQFRIDMMVEQGEKARNRVAENSSSDWSIMEELAESYGNAPMIFALTRHKEFVENGRGTWLDTMTRLREDLMRQLLMFRISNSTSGAANLINEYKLRAVQNTYEAVAGWVTVLEAAQPSKA